MTATWICPSLSAAIVTALTGTDGLSPLRSISLQTASADSCLLCAQHKPTQGRDIAERNQEREKQTRDDLHQAVGFGVTDEIEKLDRLKSAGAISEAEYSRLRARLVQ
jgi:hypothetical protein